MMNREGGGSPDLTPDFSPAGPMNVSVGPCPCPPLGVRANVICSRLQSLIPLSPLGCDK